MAKRKIVKEVEDLETQADGAEDEGDIQIITVRSTLKPKGDGDQVVLYEKDSDHPEGEAYIAGPAPVQVALTPKVKALLRAGKLEEVAADVDE